MTDEADATGGEAPLCWTRHGTLRVRDNDNLGVQLANKSRLFPLRPRVGRFGARFIFVTGGGFGHGFWVLGALLATGWEAHNFQKGGQEGSPPLVGGVPPSSWFSAPL